MESSQEPNINSAPKLPIPGKRNVLITGALPYVNNVPHLGNLIGSVLSADVFARFCRLRGHNTLYIGGTDEYGTATEIKAVEEKLTPRQICDKYHALHKQVYEWFDISFDKFGRTSTPTHTEVCQSVFKKLWENNLVSEDTMHQFYCENCQRFLADRFVEGNCPEPGCGSVSARGDQCDKCEKPLNPTQLLEPRCKVCHRHSLEIRDTKHLFLELPALEERLRTYIAETETQGHWTENASKTTQKWLEELQKRSITRDLEWGVPVPLEEYKDKVFYMWFDAPIGYVSITACYTPEWEKWWKNPQDVELYQFMGKDNVPFHTVMFPSTLIGTDEDWTLVKGISATEYLNYESGKFSKSKGIGVFGTDVKDTDIPAEVWRYYLLVNRPEASDTAFNWDDLQAKCNNELLKNLGNFINRVLTYLVKDPGYGSVIPDAENAELHPSTQALAAKVGKCMVEYKAVMEKLKLKQGLKIAMSVSTLGNGYLQETEFWRLYEEDRTQCSIVMKTSVGLVYLLATLLEPFMPSVYAKIRKQLNLHPEEESLSLCDGDIERASRPWELLPGGHRIGTPLPIFKQIKDNQVFGLRKRFAGS
ncbi:OLC1v1004538C1 [Oldenlandia corymbosa var. corymbosa]|uniref:methionine--tRNA ligase n=1 Tax=Oldenlandia corymbosa var. corymbosa TaxID=529605 RepID=A0AAV1DCJ9_OLDCO|nr:OLC1v1004538C1 [Oldenlandia corymbosa var. corymbosa]